MAQSQQLVKIHENLSKFLNQKAAALPKEFNQTRFIQNAMSVLQDTPNIESMTPQSIARTMLKGAFLGLDFFAKECYAIPYNKNIGTKEKPKYIKELQFQTDYKGEIKLARKYSIRGIKDIYAKVVRKGDVFKETVVAGEQVIEYAPVPFNQAPVIGVFAVCVFLDGGMIYETMTWAEVEAIRDKYSKAPTGPAWKNRPYEMGKKTVLRLLMKNIQLEFQSADADEAFEVGADAEFTDYEDVTDEPIPMPQAKAEPSSNEGDDYKLTWTKTFLTFGFGDDAAAKENWLKEQTSFEDKSTKKTVPGKSKLEDLKPKQVPYVYRAARELVEAKIAKIAGELYPSADDRAAVYNAVAGTDKIKDMKAPVLCELLDKLLTAKLQQSEPEKQGNLL